MFRMFVLFLGALLCSLFSVQEVFAEDILDKPQSVTQWSGMNHRKSRYTEKCSDGRGYTPDHTIDKMYDDDIETGWNYAACGGGEREFKVVFKVDSKKSYKGIAMATAGNGWHDVRNFKVYSCGTDSKGNSCTHLKDCSRTYGNQDLQRCDFASTNSTYFKITMKGWGKRSENQATGFHENGKWQYYIREVRFVTEGTPTSSAAPLDGTWQCKMGFDGPRCEFSNQITCNGNGVAQYDGSCSCQARWAGDASCSRCGEGFGGSQCNLSRADTCNNRGNPSSSSDGLPCSCDSGAAGDMCQYTDAITCNEPRATR